MNFHNVGHSESSGSGFSPNIQGVMNNAFNTADNAFNQVFGHNLFQNQRNQAQNQSSGGHGPFGNNYFQNNAWTNSDPRTNSRSSNPNSGQSQDRREAPNQPGFFNNFRQFNHDQTRSFNGGQPQQKPSKMKSKDPNQ